MRVVLYFRVSTLGQESEGQSLQNQARTAQRWALNGHSVVGTYKEAASAGTVEGRLQFSRMLDDLPVTKPDAIVVDTLDRFTRNLREGLNLLEELKGRGVGLLPLDWRRDKPLDLTDDRDWSDVIEEFTAAERERRKISRRVKRSYEGRRERGAVLSNKTPFGLVRVGDAFAADPERRWVIREIVTRLLRGDTFDATTRWAKAVDPKAWRSRRGLLQMVVESTHYLTAGLVTPDELARLRQIKAAAWGRKRGYEHEFSGVFSCPTCGRLMHGTQSSGRDSVSCHGNKDHFIYIVADKIREPWLEFVGRLRVDRARIREWVAGQSTKDGAIGLERRLAALDEEEARIKKRRNMAFDLAYDSSEGVSRQARMILSEIDADELAIHAQRQATLGQLASQEMHKYTLEEVERILDLFRDVYAGADIATRCELNRRFCQMIGSRPTLRRVGLKRWSTIEIVWPEFTSTPLFLEPSPSESWSSPRSRHRSSPQGL